MKKKSKVKQEKGITLIALIVTIVIMLILAGISIKLVIDDNGVIGNAKDAKEQYEQAQIDEENGINDMSQEMRKYIEANKIVKVDGVTIPAGFVYVGGTKDSGLVISDSSDDKEKYKGQETVGIDLEGNQFVWIPVDNIADYKRTAYAGDSLIYSSETLPDDEKTSVETNKGYYIGRYEAGDQESTASKKLRAYGASTSNTITVKAGQAPYNYIKQIDAKKLAEGFSGKQGYTSVKSKLVSSYAWDTAIEFIQKTNSDYGSSSEEGNYVNTTFTYTDIKGASQTKVNGTKTLIPTGQTTAVNNIYDMGGNVYEWTTEFSGFTGSPCSMRGGGCDIGFTANPAGYRSNGSGGDSEHIGFRITLFM